MLGGLELQPTIKSPIQVVARRTLASAQCRAAKMASAANSPES